MLDNECSITRESLPFEARRRFDEGHRLVGLDVARAPRGQGLELIYHFDRDLVASHLRLAVPERTEVPSLAGVFPSAWLEEVSLGDRFGIPFQNAPQEALFAAPMPGVRRFPLPGPLRLVLEVEKGRVLRACPDLARGLRDLEARAWPLAWDEALPFVRRVCGLCSFGHGLAFCLGVETLRGLSVPPRAETLRVLWAELHRVGSHLFWMARLARFLGFERLFLRCLRLRELVLAVLEAASGDRVISSVCVVGGVARDLDFGHIPWIGLEISRLEQGLRGLEKPLLDGYALGRRTRGVGLLTREQARVLGAVGPTLRASGWDQDLRTQGPAGYRGLDFTPCVETDGDAYSRLRVRLREALVSCDLARQCLDGLPKGEIVAPVAPGPLEGEAWVRIEQPRGEQYVFLQGDGGERLRGARMHTATAANLTPLLALLPGLDTQEAALVALSTDPCEACANV